MVLQVDVVSNQAGHGDRSLHDLLVVSVDWLLHLVRQFDCVLFNEHKYLSVLREGVVREV